MCSLCTGVRCAAPDSAYVLCLDDDAELHPSTITDLVAAVECPSSHACDARAAHGAAPRRGEDPRDGAFMATGYPFDVPAPGSGLFSYCVMAYHLPLIILFCLRGETANVWGGCMLLPLEALRSGSVALLQARSPCVPAHVASFSLFSPVFFDGRLWARRVLIGHIHSGPRATRLRALLATPQRCELATCHTNGLRADHATNLRRDSTAMRPPITCGSSAQYLGHLPFSHLSRSQSHAWPWGRSTVPCAV
jgi:hypothetical protein